MSCSPQATASHFAGRWLCVALALVLICGCGKRPPRRAPVVGTIQYAGQPVVGATVTFVPLDRTMHPASATTDAEGHYQLQTIGMGPGAIVGEHQVSVVLRGPAPPVQTTGNLLYDMQNRPIGPPLLPVRYFTPEESGLTANVADVPQNRFDFTLEP
jgi:hypothetical protein